MVIKHTNMIVSYIIDCDATIQKRRFIKSECVSEFFLHQDHSANVLSIAVQGIEHSIFVSLGLTKEEIEMEMLNLMWGNDDYKYQIFNIETKHINQ